MEPTPLPLLPVPTCAACDLSAGVRSPGIPPRHLTPHQSGLPLLICVGMNPGAQEDAAGQCFVGPPGRTLIGPYLEGSGLLAICDIYLMNAARCASHPGNPKARQYQACWRTLVHADLLAILDHTRTAPSHTLLLLGADPVATITRNLLGKKRTLSDMLSAQMTPTSLALPSGASLTVSIATTYHPAFCLRDPSALDAVASHLEMVRRHILGESSPASLPTRIKPCRPSPYRSTTTS